MALKTVTVLCLLVASSIAKHPDYCQDKYNCDGSKHVGCNSTFWNGGFGPDCRGASFVKYSPETKKAFLDSLNKYRNEIALGKVPHYDAAEQMATVRWHDGMADLAGLLVRTCRREHDQCRNTEEFLQSGQTVSIQYEDIKENYQSDTHYAKAAVKLWFDEIKNGGHYNWMDIIKKYKETDPKHEVGHLCQMIIDSSYAVGCASTKFIKKVGNHDWKAYLTVCNFPRIPVVSRPIYKNGKPGSGCKSGKNKIYPGLCSEKEKYTEPK